MKIKLFIPLILLVSAAAFGQQTAKDLVTAGVKNAEAGRFDEAIANFTDAVKLQPTLADAYLYRGSIYFQKRLREPEKSEDEKIKIAGDLRPGETPPKSPNSLKAIADLTKAIELDPAVPNAYAARAMVFQKEEDFGPAIKDLRKFLSLVPNEPQAKSELAAAEKSYVSHLMTVAPSLAVRVGNMAAGPARDKEWVAITELYSQVVQIEPENARALSYRGDAYGRAGRYDLAVADYSAVLKINPADKDVIANRAEAHLALQAFGPAQADFEKLIALPSTSDNEYARLKGYRGRGDVELAQGKLDAAIADFAQVIEASPKNQVALHRRGLAHLKKGNKAAAIADFKKVLEINPNSPQGKLTAAEVQKLGLAI